MSKHRARLNTTYQELGPERPQFKPGNPGRPYGAYGVLPNALKECILEAAALAGNHFAAMNKRQKLGVTSYLQELAINDKALFVGLLGRILPLTLQSSGGAGKPVTAEEIRERFRERGIPIPPMYDAPKLINALPSKANGREPADRRE